MSRFPQFCKIFCGSFVRYCSRVTAAWLMDELAERKRGDAAVDIFGTVYGGHYFR